VPGLGLLQEMNEIIKILFFISFLLNTNKINYITQGYSLHSFKSSKGVSVEIVERDNIW
jgi:hypothetical protein